MILFVNRKASQKKSGREIKGEIKRRWTQLAVASPAAQSHSLLHAGTDWIARLESIVILTALFFFRTRR
jgi:hypothetical protein